MSSPNSRRLIINYNIHKINGTQYVYINIMCFPILVCTVVTASPPLPPSLAQANQRSSAANNNDPKNFIKSLWRLIGNYGFILLLLSYGMNVGSFYAISTLLNQIILQYFPVSIYTSLDRIINALRYYIKTTTVTLIPSVVIIFDISIPYSL